jgi:hypothetical protein
MNRTERRAILQNLDHKKTGDSVAVYIKGREVNPARIKRWKMQEEKMGSLVGSVLTEITHMSSKSLLPQ